MAIDHNPENDESAEELDAEVREDEGVWDEVRAEFDEFQALHRSQSAAHVQKALHKWLRHHDMRMNDDEVKAKAAKISAGVTVELADLPSASSSHERPNP